MGNKNIYINAKIAELFHFILISLHVDIHVKLLQMYVSFQDLRDWQKRQNKLHCFVKYFLLIEITNSNYCYH